MPLESLHSLVETLKERIQDHSAALRVNETLTRYALIDPLLRELGWDTADPALVIPEYKSGNGRADYALLGGDGNPAMIVEAKSLGSSLRDSALTQGIQYCLEKGTKYFSLTDGNCWEIYETHRPVPIAEKRVVEFDLRGQPTAEVCLQALALWRPNLEAGSAVAGNATLMQPKHVSPEPEPKPIVVEPVAIVPDESQWQSLSNLKPASWANPPKGIIFPNNSSEHIENWKGIVVEVTKWLANEGHLDASKCPIPYSNRSKQYIVASVPVHPSNKDFRDPREVESTRIGRLYIETHSSSSDCVKKAITIIKHVGLEPAQFKVRFD